MDATPEYSYPGWFAMLFAAGMGIGLMFFGVAEPISHFSSSVAEGAGTPESWAPLAGAAGNEQEAARLGMAATIFHWGLHPWAIYAIVGLSLAIFAYNKGLPLSIRSMFYPVFGERVWGWTGHVIDTLAVFATLFGLATSLGIGAEQANAGLEFLFGMPVNDVSKVLLISGITVIALGSVLAGLDAGVKRLSEINMVLAHGCCWSSSSPSGRPWRSWPVSSRALLAYGENLLALSNPVGREDANFSSRLDRVLLGVVGVLVAVRRHVHRTRQSRGRTVREFIICVLIIPTAGLRSCG